MNAVGLKLVGAMAGCRGGQVSTRGPAIITDGPTTCLPVYETNVQELFIFCN